MTVMNILTINLLLSTAVFWIAARIYLIPRLATLSSRAVLLPILLLHSLRHLGLMFLAPLVLGFVVGSVNAFKRDYGGWSRFGFCVTACVSVIAIGLFLFWVVAF